MHQGVRTAAGELIGIKGYQARLRHRLKMNMINCAKDFGNKQLAKNHICHFLKSRKKMALSSTGKIKFPFGIYRKKKF